MSHLRPDSRKPRHRGCGRPAPGPSGWLRLRQWLLIAAGQPASPRDMAGTVVDQATYEVLFCLRGLDLNH